jgi:hypothetical protein
VYTVNSCPSCGGSNLETIPALMSQFVSYYIFSKQPWTVDLLKCRACKMFFFSQRYEVNEISKLYSNYRGEAYCNARRSVEPWYTKSFNDDLGGEKWMKKRKARIQEAVIERIEARDLGTLLDYGGDRGQFMPDHLASKRVVYDLSGAAPVEGVRAISSLADLKGDKVGAVLCCHVLEHCSDPDSVLEEIKNILKGVLYVEVPVENWRMIKWMPYKASLSWLRLVSRSGKFIQMVIEFYSLCFRKIFGFIPPLGCYVMSEHINSFSPESLRALLERNGFGEIILREKDSVLVCTATL